MVPHRKTYVWTSSKPADINQTSSLDLPLEIHNQIYELLYRHPDPVRMPSVQWSSWPITMHRHADDSNHGLVPITDQRAPSDA
jgi:hypothetical protein